VFPRAREFLKRQLSKTTVLSQKAAHPKMVQALIHSLPDVFEVQKQVRKPAVESLLLSVPEIQITLSIMSIMMCARGKIYYLVRINNEDDRKYYVSLSLEGIGSKDEYF
jgi:hypothetical protein